MEYLRRAQYHETDQMGVIHHSNYIRWFEEARVEWMEQMGFGYDRVEQAGIVSPVLSMYCEYRSMVRFGDTVRILPRMERFTGSKMTVTYRVEDAKTGELRTVGESKHCFLNREGRPVSLKKVNPEIYQLFLEQLQPS